MADRIYKKEASTFETVIIGIFCVALGSALCFAGSSLLTILFATVTTLTITFLLYIIFLEVFDLNPNTAQGILSMLLSIGIAIPIGYKSTPYTDEYALPVFSAFAALRLM